MRVTKIKHTCEVTGTYSSSSLVGSRKHYILPCVWLGWSLQRRGQGLEVKVHETDGMTPWDITAVCTLDAANINQLTNLWTLTSLLVVHYDAAHIQVAIYIYRLSTSPKWGQSSDVSCKSFATLLQTVVWKTHNTQTYKHTLDLHVHKIRHIEWCERERQGRGCREGMVYP